MWGGPAAGVQPGVSEFPGRPSCFGIAPRKDTPSIPAPLNRNRRCFHRRLRIEPEKSQCQALERTQPGLPLGIGEIRTQPHDDKRHGTITLFAAWNYLEGKRITGTERKHTHVEWLRFLRQIDRETPKDLDIHVIADNYSTHKHAKVKAWLKRHTRFHMHFTPTSSSWMNLIERFFADLNNDCIREGSFQSVKDLIAAIEDYLAARNENPKRYVWRATGEEILRKIARAREVLMSIIPS